MAYLGSMDDGVLDLLDALTLESVIDITENGEWAGVKEAWNVESFAE